MNEDYYYKLVYQPNYAPQWSITLYYKNEKVASVFVTPSEITQFMKYGKINLNYNTFKMTDINRDINIVFY